MRPRKGRTLNRGSYVEGRVASSRCVRCVSQVEILVQFKKPCLRHDVSDPRSCEARIRGPVPPQAWLSLYPHHCQHRQVGTHFCRSSFFPQGMRCAPSCDFFYQHTCWSLRQLSQKKKKNDWEEKKRKEKIRRLCILWKCVT